MSSAGLAEARRLAQSGDEGTEAARLLLIRLAEDFPDHAETQIEAAYIHDRLGLEAAAVPFYERGIALGLHGVTKPAEAYLGLGSTYRVLGRYQDSFDILEKATGLFPTHGALPVFLAMAAYNLGRHETAMRLLLTALSKDQTDSELQNYARAIGFYADKLDEVWT